MKRCPACGEQVQTTARKCRSCGEPIGGRGGSGSRRGKKKSSNSNTTVIVVVIVAVVGGGVLVMGCLAAMFFLPAIQQAREAARRTTCKNNLRQIGLALHNYHDTYRSFPPAYVADENGKPMYSWRVLLLPFVDQQALYARYDLSQPWDSPANQQVLDSMPPVYGCPSSEHGNTTNYAAAFGPNCIFSGAVGETIRNVSDGLSNTILVGEVEGSGIPWTKPVDVDIARNPGIGNPGGFNSSHAGGINVLLGDGSVRFMSESINPQTLRALFTKDGGEAVGAF